jgi:hypothetical protein
MALLHDAGEDVVRAGDDLRRLHDYLRHHWPAPQLALGLLGLLAAAGPHQLILGSGVHCTSLLHATLNRTHAIHKWRCGVCDVCLPSFHHRAPHSWHLPSTWWTRASCWAGRWTRTGSASCRRPQSGCKCVFHYGSLSQLVSFAYPHECACRVTRSSRPLQRLHATCLDFAGRVVQGWYLASEPCSGLS